MKTISTIIITFAVSFAALAQRQIPGIVAVDVYGNFTNIGFKLDRSFDNEYGNLWTCTSDPFTVYVYGRDTDDIRSVKATFQNFGGITTEATQFFGYVASLPYDGADPVKAKQWAINNINKAGTLIIGRVKFTMHVPSKAVRMLIMEGI